jgi:O-glycosyl hydrolase
MLSHYRYNIGGGGVGVNQPAPGESRLGPRSRAPQTTYVSRNHYDWSHDSGGTAFLHYAAEYHVPDIEANINSAPRAFTTNHRSCGGRLKASAIPAYVRYLAKVVRHAHDVWHATLSFVSPMNEPDYNRSDCTQEGMSVPPHERVNVIRALRAALRQGAPYAHVIADESSLVETQFAPEARQWLSAGGVSRSLAALAIHVYDFPSNATLARAASLARRYGKQLWMTEICCMVGPANHPRFGQGYNPGMAGALPMAHMIWKDLTYGHMSTWDWWTAASPSLGCDPATSRRCATAPNPHGFNGSLLYYDPHYGTDHNYAIYKTKRFWTLGNFSRFIRPGAVRHPISGSPAGVYLLAFADAGAWQLVAINQNGSGSTPLSVTFPARTALAPGGAYRTGLKLSLARVPGARRGTHDTFTAKLPPQSVTTYLFKRAPSGSPAGGR